MRIDILERLADLIRPALAWKPGVGTRPDGAYDGTRFVVTPAMMSILGATADDMEEILKNLGYRSEATDATVVSAKVAELDAVAQTTAPQETAKAASTTPAAEPVGDPIVKPVVEAVEAVAMAVAEEASAPVAETAAAPAVAEEAPKPVLLWRQAPRFEGRHNNNNRRSQGARENQREPQARNGNAPGEERQGRPNRNAGPQGEQRGERRDFRGKGGKPVGADRFKQDGGKPSGKPQQHGKRPEREERPVKIDMDSPFAKLLALKEQMKK